MGLYVVLLIVCVDHNIEKNGVLPTVVGIIF
jgi:hypothetical protein